MLHGVDMEVEVETLVLDHRLRDVDEILGHFHDRKSSWHEGELAAFHL